MERNINVGWTKNSGQLLNNESEDLLADITYSLLNGKHDDR